LQFDIDRRAVDRGRSDDYSLVAGWCRAWDLDHDWWDDLCCWRVHDHHHNHDQWAGWQHDNWNDHDHNGSGRVLCGESWRSELRW
jgi:hypothetical protein